MDKLKKQAEHQVNFKVSVAEANIIFKALGNLPFVEVYEIIGKLNEQANGQMGDQSLSANGTSAEKSCP